MAISLRKSLAKAVCRAIELPAINLPSLVDNPIGAAGSLKKRIYGTEQKARPFTDPYGQILSNEDRTATAFTSAELALEFPRFARSARVFSATPTPQGIYFTLDKTTIEPNTQFSFIGFSNELVSGQVEGLELSDLLDLVGSAYGAAVTYNDETDEFEFFVGDLMDLDLVEVTVAATASSSFCLTITDTGRVELFDATTPTAPALVSHISLVNTTNLLAQMSLLNVNVSGVALRAATVELITPTTERIGVDWFSETITVFTREPITSEDLFASVGLPEALAIGRDEHSYENQTGDGEKDLIETVEGMRELRFSVNIFREGSFDMAEELRLFLRTEEAKQHMLSYGLAFVRTSSVRDLTVTEHAKREQRSQLDVYYNTVQSYESIVLAIERLDIIGTFEGNFQAYETTIELRKP